MKTEEEKEKQNTWLRLLDEALTRNRAFIDLYPPCECSVMDFLRNLIHGTDANISGIVNGLTIALMRTKSIADSKAIANVLHHALSLEKSEEDLTILDAGFEIEE